MAKRSKGRARQHVYVETDGKVYLVRDRGTWRFPRASERLPFRITDVGRMDFGRDVVRRAKPTLTEHPEDWFDRDDLFARDDVDGTVTRAVYMTLHRLVAEVVFVRDGRVLMEKARRGFAKGYWNLPGGFLEAGERPEDGARREAAEELGVPVRIDGLLNTYVTGFPGKPTHTLGFVYRGTLIADDFAPKGDEIETVEWFPVWRALELTRNPFAKWALVDAYRGDDVEQVDVHTHVPREEMEASPAPVVFLDRDDVINRGREGYVRTPAQFDFLPGAMAAMRALQEAGYRLAVVSNQDPLGWNLISDEAVRKIHDAMLRELGASGVRLENVYYCPHHLNDGCACRKPRAGLLLAACRDLGARPWEAWMVGDKPGDVVAGKAIGARTAFVGDAKRRAKFAVELKEAKPDLVVKDLAAFAKAILGAAAAPTRPAET